jgi:predicted kinase
MTPELIMLVGMPGCGKSTWVRNFVSTEAGRQYAIISTDDMIEEAARECGITYNQAHALISSDEIVNLVFARVNECIKSGQSIVWDQTNLNVARRIEKIGMIPLKWKRKCVAFEVPLDEVKRRRDARESANPGKSIPSDILENMLADYQRPTKIEGWDEIIFINT